MTPGEVFARLDRDPRVIFPVGALLNHGPHLPGGTNTLIAEAVARHVSAETGILLAPAFPFGVVPPRAGVDDTGLGRKTLHRTINELLGGWEAAGVREFLVITAYRYEPNLDALLMALTPDALTTVFNLFDVDVSDLVERDPALEHGGELETSLMLHLEPELVRTDLIEDNVLDDKTVRKYVRQRLPPPPDGLGKAVGKPSMATAEKGRAIFRRFVDVVVWESRVDGATDGDVTGTTA